MKILNKEILAKTQDTKITGIEVYSPLIAAKAKPGQFAVLIVKPEGERIPLTIVSADKDAGSITLIFQELGFTTKLLGTLDKGDSLYSLAGPLGHPTEVKNYGKVILIGGGVGIAEIYPVAKAMKEAGNRVIAILGARTKDLVILEKELKSASDEMLIATDDGSYGRKGFTTDILKEILNTSLRATEGSEAISDGGIASPLATLGARNDKEKARPRNGMLVYAVGPIPMMKLISSITKDFNVKTIVSLNALMVDATGMCGCCRVTVDEKVKFSCIDGPEFNAHFLDWDELIRRSSMYEDKEKHICKLDKYGKGT